jgi:phosphatidylserine decarboxylase precursor
MSDALLAELAKDNAIRRLSAQNWSLGVYWLAGIAMLFHTYILAAVVAWCTPSKLVSALPDADDVRYATLYWLYPLLLLNFLITAGTGMSGWATTGVVYTLAALLLGARGQYAVWKRKSKRTNVGTGPLLNADGSLAPEQEILERELLKQFIATHSEPSAMQLRVARMLARYNPDRLNSVDEMLCNYAHTEERLILDLKLKYGPEPEPSGSTSASTPRRRASTWRRTPFPMAPTQLASILVCVLLMVLCLCGCLCIVYLWPLAEYRIVRHEGSQVVAAPEFQPEMTAKALQLMYAWPGLASDLRLQFYVSLLTTYCGTEFRKHLPDTESRRVILTEWIDKYSINMTDYSPSEWWRYSSVNEWFIRDLAPGARPVAYPGRREVVVSPADSRVLVFPNVSRATKLWIKGGRFSWRAMMDDELVDGDADYFEGGTVVVARLAPQDYHRFHSPVDGRVKIVREKSGTYWSVNADAVLSENDAFLNQRQIVVVDAGGNRGMTGLVAIGATCVGSVVLQTRERSANGTAAPLVLESIVSKGSEVGFMQFGGSTIVLLFRRGAFLPRCDLLHASTFPVESYVRMGEALGSFSEDPYYTGIGDRCVHL